MKTIILSLILMFSFFSSVISQDSIWPILYNNNNLTNLIEVFDKGYIIIGTDEVIFGTGYGMIKKTDINSQELWHINIEYKPPYSGTIVNGISQTVDGGYIVSGFTGMFGIGKPFVLKLNACAEKEWSKVFMSYEEAQSGREIYQLPDGNYLMRISRGSSQQKSIWVYKLSSLGDIIWQKYYAHDWEPGTLSNEQALDFVPDNNGDFIISGYYSKAQPGYDTNQRWKRPMFIKIDSAGNEFWHNIYGLENFYVGSTMGSCASSNGTIYTAGWQGSGPGQPPVVYKIDSGGSTVTYNQLQYQSDSTVIGRADDISIMNDTALFIIGGWRNYIDSVYYAYKVDTSLNVIKRTLLNDHGNYQGYSLVTFDNKYVAATYVKNDLTSVLDIHLWKLNSNLEFDTLYTQPFTYDSLCPYQIVSDTIELDTTTVNLDKLAETIVPMSIYPNPAKNKVRLEINIVKMKERQLVVLNLQGQRVYNATISPGRANHDIDVSNWEDGLYVFKLIESKQLIQTEKVLIVH